MLCDFVKSFYFYEFQFLICKIGVPIFVHPTVQFFKPRWDNGDEETL